MFQQHSCIICHIKHISMQPLPSPRVHIHILDDVTAHEICTTSCRGQSHPQTDRIAAGTLTYSDSFGAGKFIALLLRFVESVQEVPRLGSGFWCMCMKAVPVAPSRPKLAEGFPSCGSPTLQKPDLGCLYLGLMNDRQTMESKPTKAPCGEPH